MIYDYLIVGSGIFGSIFAYEANKLGKKVLVIEKRNHIGGNCYTEKYEDYHLHKYGPHIFHTSQKYIWDYLNQFVSFLPYQHKVKANVDGKLFSLPVNLFTINQLWPDINTPEQAIAKIRSEVIPCENPTNLEDHILSMIGPTLYEKFIKGYTTKQWGKNPKLLPASIIKRLPIRYNHNDRWYHDNDIYEGIPTNGYTEIFEKLLKDVETLTNIDYFADREYWDKKAKKVVFSGQIEQYFGYMFGDLEYRTLEFKNIESKGDFQGTSLINYPSSEIAYTRIMQHKHFVNSKSENDYVTYEYSKTYDSKDKNQTPYYPVNTQENNDTYKKYKEYAEKEFPNLIIGGRLGNYRYYDMDMAVGNALATVKKEFTQNP
jgi:UDP-galactopyranose mutase